MKDNATLRTFAFWLACLCAILLLPQIWRGSGWLSDQVLAPEFGTVLTIWFLRPLVFLCLLMCGLFAARATLASSVGIIVLAILAKLPL